MLILLQITEKLHAISSSLTHFLELSFPKQGHKKEDTGFFPA